MSTVNRRVLVIEDDPMSAYLIKAQLSNEANVDSYIIEEETDIAMLMHDLTDYCKDSKYDLFIVDMNLNNFDGTLIGSMINNLNEERKPMIYVSGDATYGEQFENLGIDIKQSVFMPKPLHQYQIVAQVRAML